MVKQLVSLKAYFMEGQNWRSLEQGTPGMKYRPHVKDQGPQRLLAQCMLGAEIADLLPYFGHRTLPRRSPPSRIFSGDSNLQPRRKTERSWQKGFPNTWSDEVKADGSPLLDRELPIRFLSSSFLFITIRKLGPHLSYQRGCWVLSEPRVLEDSRVTLPGDFPQGSSCKTSGKLA